MKYTCQPTENSLDELGIPKNPYFDPSHASVASFWLIPGGGRFTPPPCPDAHIYIPTLKGLMGGRELSDDLNGVAHCASNTKSDK